MAAALEIPGWQHTYSGKVRDLYVPDSGAKELLVVTRDTISAYDFVLSTPIPDKGAILTQLTLWWFEQLPTVPNHILSTDVPTVVTGRAVICRQLDMFPFECVARGYLTGSGLKEYQANSTVCGIRLPAGLVDGSRLAEAIFTPATKAEIGEHDENVDFARVETDLGTEDAATLRNLTLQVYRQAEQIAAERGIILADTKFEFGRDPQSGQVMLADEVLTPDSSRFWDKTTWEPGRPQASFDKQFVRDWLTSPASGWNKESGEAPPSLPEQIVEQTRARYLEAYKKLTGLNFQ